MRRLAVIVLAGCASAADRPADHPSGSPVVASSAGAPTSAAARPSAPSDRARLESLCRELDSGDLDVRVNATRALGAVAGHVSGGTEQQMEAAGKYCIESFGSRPFWLRR